VGFIEDKINKISNDRLEGLIRSMIKDLEKRKDKAMIRSDTDDLWTKIETLQWVMYVIFAIRNKQIVVI
jgi:DNA replication initiation complex subunit (GINS family)